MLRIRLPQLNRHYVLAFAFWILVALPLIALPLHAKQKNDDFQRVLPEPESPRVIRKVLLSNGDDAKDAVVFGLKRQQQPGLLLNMPSFEEALSGNGNEAVPIPSRSLRYSIGTRVPIAPIEQLLR